MKTTEDIVPIAEFKAHASRLLRVVQQTRRPLIITNRGRAAAVMLAPEEYDRMSEELYRLAVVDRVTTAMAESEAGLGMAHAEFNRELDELLDSLEQA